MQALHRKYELYIGVLPELVKKEKVADAKKSDGKIPSVNIKTIPAEKKFIMLDNHQMEADIKFPKEGKGNKTTTQSIVITNPGPDVIEFLDTGNVILLKAGYNVDQFLPIICAAQIIKTEVVKNATDRILTITCAEAFNARRKIWYSKSFLPSQTKRDVLDDMLRTFKTYGVGVGRVQVPEGFDDKQLGTHYTAMGNLNNHLEKFCSNNKLKWYIAGGDIYVEPTGKKFNDYLDVVEITYGQVKESIEVLDDSTKKTSKELETKTKGVKFRVNLLAAANRGDGVRIIAKDTDPESFKKHEGVYLITSVAHNMSFEGDPWDTIIEAKG